MFIKKKKHIHYPTAPFFWVMVCPLVSPMAVAGGRGGCPLLRCRVAQCGGMSSGGARYLLGGAALDQGMTYGCGSSGTRPGQLTDALDPSGIHQGI